MSLVPLRLNRANVLLAVVDMQERFRDLIYDMNLVKANCSRLMRFCEKLDIPIIVSEHYPQKLGRTIDELSGLVANGEAIEKISFSCIGDHLFKSRLKSTRRDQVVLCGIEAHVCIYQTAKDLLDDGYQVVVTADAVSSRQVASRNLALATMRDLGVQVLTTEMVMFEILKIAKTDEFHAVAKILAENPLPRQVHV